MLLSSLERAVRRSVLPAVLRLTYRAAARQEVARSGRVRALRVNRRSSCVADDLLEPLKVRLASVDTDTPLRNRHPIRKGEAGARVRDRRFADAMIVGPRVMLIFRDEIVSAVRRLCRIFLSSSRHTYTLT